MESFICSVFSCTTCTVLYGLSFKVKDVHVHILEQVFCGCFIKCIFLNLREPFAFKNFSLVSLPFKKSNCLCKCIYIDLN